MEAFSRFLTPTILFLSTLASGYWLSHSGRPFGVLRLNVHKLIALGALIAAGLQFARLLKLPALAPGTVLLVVAATCALALVVTGGLLSLVKPAPAFVLRIHQVAPYLLLASTAASLWL